VVELLVGFPAFELFHRLDAMPAWLDGAYHLFDQMPKRIRS